MIGEGAKRAHPFRGPIVTPGEIEPGWGCGREEESGVLYLLFWNRWEDAGVIVAKLQ